MVKDDSFDVVIAGGGLSGMTAAAEAGERGLKALVVEKADILGGRGNYVETPGAFNSRIAKKAGIHYNLKDVMKDSLSYTHYRAIPAQLRNVYVQSGKDMDWLEDHGTKFAGVVKQGTSYRVCHTFAGGGHQAIYDALIPTAKKGGVKFLTGTSIVDVKMDDNNHVCGAIIEKVTTHERQTVKTKNVILATGGYFDNPEMVQKYTEHQQTEMNMLIPVSTGKATGDGLRIAWKHGARKYLHGYVEVSGAYIKDPTVPAFSYFKSPTYQAASQEGLLWVNGKGQRFVNEDCTNNLSEGGEAIMTQSRVFGIMSQDQIDHLNDVGLYKSIGNSPIQPKNLPVKAEIAKFKKEGKKFLHIADSIEKLGQDLGLPELADNVKHYNDLCAKGEDEDFFKDAKYMIPLKKGPFYAIEMGCAATDTLGGLKVDLQNRVLNDRDYPIPGLYSAGTDAAGVVVGDTYAQNFQGLTSTYCIYSGRNAIRSIAQGK